MKKGIPLNDNDRMPWLQALAALMRKHLEDNKGTLVSEFVHSLGRRVSGLPLLLSV